MLLFKECKKVLFSLTFWIYFITVLAMFFTQFYPDCKSPVSAPVPGQEDYGTIAKEIPELLMPAAAESLVSEYLSGSFIAYPLGFYKEVHLSEKKKEKMEEIITEISGITQGQTDSMTYEHFRDLMREADDLIGGGSRYGDESIVDEFSRVSMTYEDALEEYEQFLYEDKITEAYARLFCDYLGIVIALLPVFTAVSLSGFDKKSRMEQLAYAKSISSANLIFTRYAALVLTQLLPVVITAAFAQFKIAGLYSGQTLNDFAFFQYAAAWLIPNIMAASAIGMIITECVSGLPAIFIQGVWWFASLFAGTGGLSGNIGKLTLVLRHNSLYDRSLFYYENFIFNRIFFAAAAIIAIAITAFIYEHKRRGRYHVFPFGLQNPRRKSAA